MIAFRTGPQVAWAGGSGWDVADF